MILGTAFLAICFHILYLAGEVGLRKPDIAVFQPVVNGVGGNLVAIFASRLSTVLHLTSTQGSIADWTPSKWFLYPFDTFFGKKSNLQSLSLFFKIANFSV